MEMIWRQIILIPLVHHLVSLFNVASKELRIKQGRCETVLLQLTADIAQFFRIGGKFDRKRLIPFLCRGNELRQLNGIEQTGSNTARK